MPCVWQPENTEAFTLPLDKKKKYIWSINAVTLLRLQDFLPIRLSEQLLIYAFILSKIPVIQISLTPILFPN